jgi:hypothetical protein
MGTHTALKKPPCAHSLGGVKDYGHYGRPGDCIIPYAGRPDLGVCSACGAIFQRATADDPWHVVPWRQRRRKAHRLTVAGPRLPGMETGT